MQKAYHDSFIDAEKGIAPSHPRDWNLFTNPESWFFVNERTSGSIVLTRKADHYWFEKFGYWF